MSFLRKYKWYRALCGGVWFYNKHQVEYTYEFIDGVGAVAVPTSKEYTWSRNFYLRYDPNRPNIGIETIVVEKWEKFKLVFKRKASLPDIDIKPLKSFTKQFSFIKEELEVDYFGNYRPGMRTPLPFN